MQLAFLGILLSLSLTACDGEGNHRRRCQSSAVEILTIKAALDRILVFLEKRPEDLNLDGTAVIRIGQGKTKCSPHGQDGTLDLGLKIPFRRMKLR